MLVERTVREREARQASIGAGYLSLSQIGGQHIRGLCETRQSLHLRSSDRHEAQQGYGVCRDGARHRTRQAGVYEEPRSRPARRHTGSACSRWWFLQIAAELSNRRGDVLIRCAGTREHRFCVFPPAPNILRSRRRTSICLADTCER
jgi:hypothetical protein